MLNLLYQPGTGGVSSIYNINSCSWPFWRHSLYIFSSSQMFKDHCSSGLTQKVQHWKLFVRSLQDPQGKQFFLILSAKHKAHFPQHKNKSYSPSSLVGSLTNFILSNCFWPASSRFQASFSSWWTLGDGVKFLRLLQQTASTFKYWMLSNNFVFVEKNPFIPQKYLWNLLILICIKNLLVFTWQLILD